MKNWWPSLFILICFSVAVYSVRQANTISDPIVTQYLSGEEGANFKSNFPELNYLESIQLIYNSAAINAKIKLRKTADLYDFQFTSLYNPKHQWSIQIEKSGELITLTKVEGLACYKKIIYCK